MGGGVAGLSAAMSLKKAGVPFVLLEAADDVGGRVRTDRVDGFLLDRGFQIFLTGYPSAQRILDYEALDLRPFYAGALVHFQGAFHRVADPFRHPVDAVLSLLPSNPVGSVIDKVFVGLVRFKSLVGSLEDVWRAPETTTLARLKAEGFSDAMIDRFFRPFLGGIFFNNELTVTSRLFTFVMRTLATGSNCLPAQGIGAVSEWMKGQVGPSNILCNAKVASIGEDRTVTLASGALLRARAAIIVAVEGPEASRLLGERLTSSSSPSKREPGVGTACLYFKAPKAPRDENILYLNGEGRGLVNNCCVPSTVAPSYAPPGQALISVSTVGTQDQLSDDALAATVKKELAGWFSATDVESWSLLKVYRIPFAQPSQAPPTNLQRPVELGGGLFVCGDHRDSATLEGALRSGERAAEAAVARR